MMLHEDNAALEHYNHPAVMRQSLPGRQKGAADPVLGIPCAPMRQRKSAGLILVETERGPSASSHVTSISFAVVTGAELVCELADIMQGGP